MINKDKIFGYGPLSPLYIYKPGDSIIKKIRELQYGKIIDDASGKKVDEERQQFDAAIEHIQYYSSVSESLLLYGFWLKWPFTIKSIRYFLDNPEVMGIEIESYDGKQITLNLTLELNSSIQNQLISGDLAETLNLAFKASMKDIDFQSANELEVVKLDDKIIKLKLKLEYKQS